MDTFKDLYNFLQLYEGSNIITWLEEPWIGKDKQESLLHKYYQDHYSLSLTCTRIIR